MPTKSDKAMEKTVAKLETEIKPSQALRFLESISDLVYECDSQGNIVYVNSAVKKFTTKEKEDIVGKPFVPLFEEKDHRSLIELYQKTLAGQSLKNTLTFKSGVIAHLTSQPLKDNRGEVIGTFGIARNITEEMKTKEALNKSEQRYTDLTHTVADLIWEVDAEYNYTFLTGNSEGILGCSRVELLGKSRFGLLSKDARDEAKKAFKEAASNDSSIKNLEYWIQNKNGDQLYLTTNALPILDNNKKLVGYRGVDRDVTRRKRTEDALKEARDRFNQVTEQSPSVYELYDINGLQIEVNKAYEDLWQFPEGRARTVGSFNVLKSKEVVDTGLIDFIKRAYAGELVTLPPYEFDPSGETEAGGVGRKRWLSTKIYPLKDVNGVVTNIVITHEDISDSVYTQKKNEELQEQIHQTQKMEAVGQLAAGIAHDFNNMLHGIVSYANLILKVAGKKSNATAKLEKFANRILNASYRASDLIKQLMGFARKDKYNPQIIDLNSTIKEACSLLIKKVQVEKQQLYFHRDKKHEKLLNAVNFIAADKSQMFTVLQNLILNALQAGKKGTSIEVGTEDVSIDETKKTRTGDMPPGEYLKLTVQDDAKGKEEGVISRIFEPFFTTKEKDKGTGLGLASVFGIVTNHHGYIDVVSSVDPGNHGTRFDVYFPTVVGQKSEVMEKHVETITSGKILVVDDEYINRDVLKESLELRNYDVVTASSGEEAFELFKNDKFDLVITDLIMPGRIDGTDLFYEIKRLQPDAKVIAISGYQNDKIVAEMIEAGVIEFVRKPIKPDDLYQIVNMALSSD